MKLPPPSPGAMLAVSQPPWKLYTNHPDGAAFEQADAPPQADRQPGRGATGVIRPAAERAAQGADLGPPRNLSRIIRYVTDAGYRWRPLWFMLLGL